MRCNSDLLVNFVGNSSLLDDFHSDNVDEKFPLKAFSEGNHQPKGQHNYLNKLWKRLIFRPLSFSQDHNTPIINILKEETNLLASNSIQSVLSTKLELPINSKKLSEVIKDTFKIFHEDFPWDFILEYRGERLGMMMLDKCLSSSGEEKLIYRFHPHLKSFRGL